MDEIGPGLVLRVVLFTAIDFDSDGVAYRPVAHGRVVSDVILEPQVEGRILRQCAEAGDGSVLLLQDPPDVLGGVATGPGSIEIQVKSWRLILPGGTLMPGTSGHLGADRGEETSEYISSSENQESGSA